jgi:hypothetical protein
MSTLCIDEFFPRHDLNAPIAGHVAVSKRFVLGIPGGSSDGVEQCGLTITDIAAL